MNEINEWTFAADVCKTIQAILADNPSLPFSEAKVEEGVRGKRQRRDLTLYGAQGRSVLTGEIKLPDRPDGQSPYRDPLVEDAFEKANAKGLEYFFTWNVNRFVLWKTFEPGKPLADRELEHFNVTSITSSEELSNPSIQTEIRGFLTQFLGRYARILEGTEPIRSRPLDEKFVRVLESALELPILQTRNALIRLYGSDKRFRRDFDAWMRESQGWIISAEPEILRDNIERAAKFSCYVLVNKIVFQQALRRRFPSLRKVRIPETLKSAAKLQDLLKTVFEEAKRVSRDYETVFDGGFGDTLPFLEDATVASWREFLREIEGFDFAEIEYDVIGQIFERLISPEERHRYGQHYTRSEIVDLINAFSIREAGATVLDPACGGGTFLVRAYALKRNLSAGALSHVDLLQQIKGTDVSAYAAHLSTINLATRDLIDERNYPLVARSDFFKVKRGEAIFHVPMSVHGKGKQTVPLEIGDVDAVVGNPPYVRQEELSREYKESLNKLIEGEFPDAELSGRSDLHCYFWPHATSFLKGGGYYGFLTSSAWLDTEYGFHLQEWLLQHFEVLALFESNCEPWFTGARVTTVATLMRREADPAKRASNTVRFVQLRRPLKEILESFDPDPLKSARMLRDSVEGQRENLLDDRWRTRVVNQHDLWKAGCTGGVAGAETASGPQAQRRKLGEQQAFQGEYAGGKWGIYLRAPDIFFRLLDRCSSHLVPLGQIAEIRFGVKSGADKFFFVRDATEEEIQKCSYGLPPHSSQIARRFKDKWGISIAETKRLRVIEAGDGSRHLIEAEYLEPYVHGFMDISSPVIRPGSLARRILTLQRPPEKLRGSYALRYVRWGEREGFDQTVTVRARSRSRMWYDLVPERRGEIIWPKLQQYRHAVALNPERVIVNCNLYDLFCREGVDPETLAAILNSTVVALSRHQFGSFMGREGNLVTEIVDAKILLTPDPRKCTKQTQQAILAAFSSMRKRESLTLPQEFTLPDRRLLDGAVLELLGYAEPAEREAAIGDLYEELARIYSEIRHAEVEMQKLRRLSARRDRASPHTIAAEIWAEFDKDQIRAFPGDFIPDGEPIETVTLPAGMPNVIDDLFHKATLQVNGQLIKFDSKARAEFAAKIVEAGHYGEAPIPKSVRACQRAMESYGRYAAQMEAKFQELAEERSADRETQSRIVRELWKLFYAYTRHA